MAFSEQFLDRMGKGRPSKLTPEIAKIFLDTYRSTCNITASAHRAGLGVSTVFTYLERGKDQRSGPYREFLEELTRARGEYIALLASTHHRMAVGGIRRKPKTQTIVTDKAAVETTLIERDANNEIIWEEHWQEPDPRAMEWEMRRLDRTTYGDETTVNVGGDGEQAGLGKPAVEVLGIFSGALELMRQFRVTPTLPVPRPGSKESIIA